MDDVIRGGVCRFVMLRLHCRHFNWNGLEWPGTNAMPNRCTKISAGTGTVIVTVSGTVPGTVIVPVTIPGIVTVPGPVTVTVPGPVTVTVTVPVTPNGCREARRVEGWLSMLLRRTCASCGLLYGFAGFAAIVLSAAVNCVHDVIFRNKLLLNVPLLFKSK